MADLVNGWKRFKIGTFQEKDIGARHYLFGNVKTVIILK